MNTEIAVPIRVVGIEALQGDGLLNYLRANSFEGIEIYQNIGPFAQAGPKDKLWVVVGQAGAIFGLVTSLITLATQLKGTEEPSPKVQINVYSIVATGNEHVHTIQGKVGSISIDDLIKQTKDSLELLNTQIDLEKAKTHLEEVRNGNRYRKIH